MRQKLIISSARFTAPSASVVDDRCRLDPKAGAAAEGHLPANSSSARTVVDDTQPRSRRSDVAIRSDPPARQDRRGGHVSDVRRHTRQRRQSRGAVPEAHRRASAELVEVLDDEAPSRRACGFSQRRTALRGCAKSAPTAAPGNSHPGPSRGRSARRLCILYKILKTLRAVEELGPLIPGKILGLILLSFISILVSSNVITALLELLPRQRPRSAHRRTIHWTMGCISRGSRDRAAASRMGRRDEQIEVFGEEEARERRMTFERTRIRDEREQDQARIFPGINGPSSSRAQVSGSCTGCQRRRARTPRDDARMTSFPGCAVGALFRSRCKRSAIWAEAHARATGFIVPAPRRAPALARRELRNSSSRLASPALCWRRTSLTVPAATILPAGGSRSDRTSLRRLRACGYSSTRAAALDECRKMSFQQPRRFGSSPTIGSSSDASRGGESGHSK